MVSLAEQAAKNKSVPDMAKVEGLMTKLSIKYASLRTSDNWTEKHTKKYEKLTAKYGIAHKEFGKNVGKDIGNTAKEFGKDMGKAGKKVGKELKKLFPPEIAERVDKTSSAISTYNSMIKNSEKSKGAIG
jgi:hemerythrin